MSQAFVKEGDAEWLHDLPPTFTVLVNYLTQENNGIRVYEKNVYVNPSDGKAVHFMSNGLSYSISAQSRWYVLD